MAEDLSAELLGPSLPSGITSDAVRTQLEKILSSRAFSGAKRHSELLRYIIIRFLSGIQIKEYPIAVDVFGRTASFDPRTDPIVRVEAGRLRSRLNSYYKNEAQSDSIVIELSSRGYRPVFRRVAGLESEPAVAVLPFLMMSDFDHGDELAERLTEELIDTLTDVPGIRVAPRLAVLQRRGETNSLDLMPQSFRANLIIEGSIRKIGTELEVRARIVNVALGHSERLANFKVAAASVPEIVREISSSIVLEARKMLQLVSEPPAIGATVPLCLASPL